MKIYLDNCCFNRPFDDQSQLRIKLESEAKLRVQEEIRRGSLELVWSYILDYENGKNPYQERKIQIAGWRQYSIFHVKETSALIEKAHFLNKKGLKKIDALHVASAISSNCDWFLTTDDQILKSSEFIKQIKITDPIGFIKEVLS